MTDNFFNFIFTILIILIFKPQTFVFTLLNMHLIKQNIAMMQNKTFDEKLSDLCAMHEYAKDDMAKEKKFGNVIVVLKDIKQKLSELTTNNPERIEIKKNMMIKLCEHIVYCMLKENLPFEGIKMIEELEIIQDVLKEKNTKALLYKARCYMMLNDVPKAFDNFSSVHSLTDNDKIKKDIELILKKLKSTYSELKNQKTEKVRDFEDLSVQIQEFSDSLKMGDNKFEVVLEPLIDNEKKIELNALCNDEDLDVDIKNAKKEVNSLCPTYEIIEINAMKSSTGILSEFLTKFSNETPAFTLEETITEAGNRKIFKVSCCCIGHTEKGIDATMKKAKENAAQKMITYLQDSKKLKLIGI